MHLQKHDVNLQKQEYRIIIKKGKIYTETIKVIIPAAVPLWEEVLSEAKDDDLLFSRKLKPGKIKIESNQITRRWNRHIKKKLGITADFYSLKHSFLDLVDKQKNGQNLSTKLASHTNSHITDKFYLVGKKERENEILKKLDIDITKILY